MGMFDRCGACCTGSVDDVCPIVCPPDTTDCPSPICATAADTDSCDNGPCVDTWVIVASAVVTDVSGPVTIPLGNWPAGQYILAYCGGAMSLEKDSHGNPINWRLTPGLALNIGGGSSDVPGGGFFTTPGACEAANAGLNTQFGLSGPTDLSIVFTDLVGAYGDNTSDDPTYSLYQYKPAPFPTAKIEFISACASWTTLGVSAQVSFSIRNQNCVTWKNVTATLAASGGIGSPSAPVPANMPPVSNTPFVFGFNTATTGVTATLTLTCPDWPGAVTFTFTAFLAPVIIVSAVQAVGNNSCGINRNFIFTNSGNWTISPTQASITGTNGTGLVKSLTPCAVQNAVPAWVLLNAGSIACNGGTNSTPAGVTGSGILLRVPTGLHQFTITFVLIEGATNQPPSTGVPALGGISYAPTSVVINI